MIYLFRLRVHERWVYVDIMENVCRDIGQQTCEDGISSICSFSKQLACIKQHASHSQLLQVFPFAEHSRASFG